MAESHELPDEDLPQGRPSPKSHSAGGPNHQDGHIHVNTAGITAQEWVGLLGRLSLQLADPSSRISRECRHQPGRRTELRDTLARLIHQLDARRLQG